MKYDNGNTAVEVLLSTIDEGIRRFVKLNRAVVESCAVKYTAIWQVEEIKEQAKDSVAPFHDVYQYRERGISKSRNRALSIASGDICLFTDDDIQFVNGYDRILLQAFREYSEADIITFQVGIRDHDPQYSPNLRWHSMATLMHVSSVEIAFRRSSIVKCDLAFDERFGLGAPYCSGEENIFLVDAYRKGLKILYYPVLIAVHHGANHEKKITDAHYIRSKGALISRLFGRLALLADIGFTIKKYPLYKKHMTLRACLANLLKGNEDFRKSDGDQATSSLKHYSA